MHLLCLNPRERGRDHVGANGMRAFE